MQKYRINATYLLLILSFFCSCNNTPKKTRESGELIQVEGAITGKDNTSVTDFTELELDQFPAFESIRVNNDTLFLLGNDVFAYFPFGKHTDPNEVADLNKCEQFKYVSKDNITSICYINGPTSLAFKLTEPGEYTYDGNFATVYASINDDSIHFDRDIHVGMSYSSFLDNLGIKEIHQFVNTVQWTSCLYGCEISILFDEDENLSHIGYQTDYIMYNEVKQHLERIIETRMLDDSEDNDNNN